MKINPLSRVSVRSKSIRTGKKPSKRLIERRMKTQKAPPGFYANPLTRVKLRSPSLRTKEPPSKRLIKRRMKTQKAPPGYYANPQHRETERLANFVRKAVKIALDRDMATVQEKQADISYAHGAVDAATVANAINENERKALLTALKNKAKHY